MPAVSQGHLFYNVSICTRFAHRAVRKVPLLPAVTTIGDMQGHLDLCKKAIVKCPICQSELEKMKIMPHFAIEHKKEYSEKLNECVQIFTKTENSLSSKLKHFGRTRGCNRELNRDCYNCRYCGIFGCHCSGFMKKELEDYDLPKSLHGLHLIRLIANSRTITQRQIS